MAPRSVHATAVPPGPLGAVPRKGARVAASRLCRSCRWSEPGRIRFCARVRAVVFLRARMSAARAPPVDGRALSRRPALRPSPAPACAASCLARAPAGFQRRMTCSRVLACRGKKPVVCFPHVRPPASYPFIRPRQAFLCQVVSCHEVSLGRSHRQEHAWPSPAPVFTQKTDCSGGALGGALLGPAHRRTGRRTGMRAGGPTHASVRVTHRDS